MKKKIAILSGDGIGPEVMQAALKVLSTIEKRFNHEFQFEEALVGGAAYDKQGEHLPKKTLEICENSDAILFGSVGGPVSEQGSEKWKNCEKISLLGLRKHFLFNANFRPAKIYSALADICPLKNKLIASGIDVLVIRELLGGIYFGEHKTEIVNQKRKAIDVAEYTEDQISSIAHIGFQAAKQRKQKLVSVDKANVLDTSKLWRTIVTEVHSNYPEVMLEHMLVDNCAMQIIQNPSYFDVILTENMFGDIISDTAAVLPGSLGLMPSASLNSNGFGMYEPSGGSAQDIAGKNIANPTAQILSAAMMLKFSFGLSEESKIIEDAVEKVISDGGRTIDIAREDLNSISTLQFTERIVNIIKHL